MDVCQGLQPEPVPATVLLEILKTYLQGGFDLGPRKLPYHHIQRALHIGNSGPVRHEQVGPVVVTDPRVVATVLSRHQRRNVVEVNV